MGENIQYYSIVSLVEPRAPKHLRVAWLPEAALAELARSAALVASAARRREELRERARHRDASLEPTWLRIILVSPYSFFFRAQFGSSTRYQHYSKHFGCEFYPRMHFALPKNASDSTFCPKMLLPGILKTIFPNPDISSYLGVVRWSPSKLPCSTNNRQQTVLRKFKERKL